MIVAGEVAIYALLSYARHARAPSLGRATTEESSPGFETPVVAVRLAKALWQIRPERAWLAAVAEILADQDINDMRRLDAALALAVFRDPLAVSALVRALDDRHKPRPPSRRPRTPHHPRAARRSWPDTARPGAHDVSCDVRRPRASLAAEITATCTVQAAFLAWF